MYADFVGNPITKGCIIIYASRQDAQAVLEYFRVVGDPAPASHGMTKKALVPAVGIEVHPTHLRLKRQVILRSTHNMIVMQPEQLSKEIVDLLMSISISQ